MAEIPDYLFYHEENVNNFVKEEINDTVVMTIENSSIANHVVTSPVVFVLSIIFGVVAFLFLCSVGSLLFFFIKNKPHREVQKRSQIYMGK
jgi:hypothetical protein